jgi:hypothetical protein
MQIRITHQELYGLGLPIVSNQEPSLLVLEQVVECSRPLTQVS